tara:strand:- start:5669 stop:5869 length:201 start_codon:yes stop_codon:yes gene_type:complete
MVTKDWKLNYNDVGQKEVWYKKKTNSVVVLLKKKGAWEEMKEKDKEARFPDAMKAAKKTYKKEDKK